jgi:maltose alpha-D-glucosyltransferase/alpha-amylase
VVANLSRFPQPVALDLSAFQHSALIELFGRTEFPEINERPYFLSLGPHSFYWFSVEPKFARVQAQSDANGNVALPTLALSNSWHEIFGDRTKFELKGILPDYLKVQPWFRGKSRAVKLFTLKEDIPIKLPAGADARLAFLQVDYVDGDSELYCLPLAFTVGPEADRLRQHAPERIIAALSLTDPAQTGILHDAFGSPDFCAALLEMLWQRRLKTPQGEIEILRLAEFRRIMGEASPPKPSGARYEQSNSSVIFEDKLMLKLFRRLEPGPNPELEMGRFLNSHSFPHCQTLVAGIDYAARGGDRFTLAVAHAFIPSSITAWDFTLDALGRYYDRVITWVAQGQSATIPQTEPVQLLQPDFPAPVAETIGTFLESARLLGVRTAELHRVLASDRVNSAFSPEPSTPHHRRAVFQSMRNLAVQNLRLLRQQTHTVAPETLPLAQRVAELEPAIIQTYHELSDQRLPAQRLRLHGDCRLGQVLWTGKDFVFIDFEGDSSLHISERRLKHSPVRDVAAMIRSFHYAASVGLDQHVQRGSIPPENMLRFQSWLRYWNLWVSVAFLKAYFQAIASAAILPDNEEAVRVMLRAYLLDRAINELGRQLKEGGSELVIPLTGILFLLREPVPPAPPVKGPPAQPAPAAHVPMAT